MHNFLFLQKENKIEYLLKKGKDSQIENLISQDFTKPWNFHELESHLLEHTSYFLLAEKVLLSSRT